MVEINNTFLTLIPKKSNYEGLGDFLPIALCNTIYKILTKTLAKKLKTLLPKIISEEQMTLLPKRSILDGIIIIQEIIHLVNLKKEASMLRKLDIQKANDKINWRFLCKTLEALGFSHQWENIIFNCISSPKISLLTIRTPKGFFNISREYVKGTLFHHSSL